VTVGKRVDFEIPPGTKRSRCSACEAEVWFARVRKRDGTWSRVMPFECSTFERRGGATFAEAHHAYCPDAERFRRKRSS
jgi:RNase P subunit RPR2